MLHMPCQGSLEKEAENKTANLLAPSMVQLQLECSVQRTVLVATHLKKGYCEARNGESK